jgi:long-chain acyl-CoA synthetase
MLSRLHDTGVDLSSLKVFVSGGSLLTPDYYTKIRRAFSIDLLHGYGLTEFTPISRNVRLQARAGTVGTIGEGIECRIYHPDAAGVGEIQIKTPNVAAGYLLKDSESQDAFLDGWFRTGDMGKIEGNHLIFVKEIKETRKINGNIVDLQELRRAIVADHDVADCQVTWENNALSAKLAVSSRIDFGEKAQETKARLRELIAEYKIPRHIDILK